MKRIARSEGRAIPWGNGQGTSREILLVEAPAADGTREFVWRLAETRIDEACPFSSYPGLDRTIVLLKGNGFVLRHARREAQSARGPFDSLTFGGDWKTSCEPFGPVEVLNVMWARDRVTCAIGRFDVSGESGFAIGPDAKGLVVLRGRIRAGLGGTAAPVTLRERDALTLDLDGPARLDLSVEEATATALLVEIRSAS